MKIRLEGHRLVASLEDEGKPLTVEAALSLRYADGQILPVLVFGKAPEGAEQVFASVQRRIVKLLGSTHVAPWGGKTFPLAVGVEGKDGQGSSVERMKSLPKLPRL